MHKEFKKCCLVVGAGASRGALVNGISVDNISTPPLDMEFLGYAKKLFKRRGRKDDALFQEGKKTWRDLENKLRKTVGSDAIDKWRLETLASYLEARRNVRFQNNQGSPHDYQAALDNLNTIVCYVLSLSGGTETCDIHKNIISFLRPKSIISFNYDLILDQTLLDMNRLNWSDKDYNNGKTVVVYQKNKAINLKWYQTTHRPHKPKKGITVYKLHGSIHWQRMQRGNGYRIAGIEDMSFKQDIVGKQFNYIHPPENPFIIPPIAAKMQIPKSHLDEVWNKAFKQLKNAHCWIIWGYSFPQTDTLTTVLLKTCLLNSKKDKPVIVINPDYSVKKRVETMLIKVRVEQFSSATEFLLKHGKIQLPTID